MKTAKLFILSIVITLVIILLSSCGNKDMDEHENPKFKQEILPKGKNTGDTIPSLSVGQSDSISNPK